jgi:hypothetical protein
VRTVIAAAILGILLVGCGGDDDVIEAGQGTTSTSTPTTTSVPPDTTTTSPEEPVNGDISLTVQVTADNQRLREGTLTCGAGAVEGTGFLADPAAAQAACDLLTGDPAAVHRLVQGRNPDMMCTQIYGGPEVAKVVGTIGDQRVATTITRTDGCGIAEWSMLVALLGPPDA